MKELLIIGGSPFVNKVNLTALDFNYYDVLGINNPPLNIPCHYVLGVDDIHPVTAPKTELITKSNGYKLQFNSKRFKVTQIPKLCRPYLHNVYIVADKAMNNGNLLNRYKNAKFLIFCNI